MSASPVDSAWLRRSIPALIVVALAIGALGAPAMAGSHSSLNQPLQLVPPATPGPSITPAPGHSLTETESGQPDQSVAKRTADIEVNALDEIAPDSIGTLDSDSGGFGIQMWQGSERRVVARLLRLLPVTMNSRAMRSLAHRLLMSIASPPIGRFDYPEAEEPSLLVLRLERLMALGNVRDVNDLLAIVPSRQADEFIARTRVDGLLLTNDVSEACRYVRNGMADFHQFPYWQKAMVLCQMIAGEIDQMMLGLDLLRERGGADDPVFFALSGAVLGAKPELPGNAVLTPLHLAMMRAIGAPLPAGLIGNVPPALLAAIARMPNATVEQQAEAAESACSMGLVDGAALARVYEAFSFTAEELANSISAAESIEGPRQRALLYQAAQAQTLPASRAEILRLALELGEQAGRYQALVSVYLPLLIQVSVRPDLAWFAGTAGRALHAAGRYEQASAWLMLGRQEAIINPQAATGAALLWPYSRLAGGAALTTDGSLAAWRAMREGMGDDALDRGQTLLRAVFQALGERDPLSWSVIAANGAPAGRPAPNAALLYALVEAGEARRIGETVLLSLVVLGEQGPGDSHVFALSTVLTALRRIGLESEARALAIEAALANGI